MANHRATGSEASDIMDGLNDEERKLAGSWDTELLKKGLWSGEFYADYINSKFDGNDTFYGMDGNDWIIGWDGDDYLDGGEGNDSIYGDGADYGKGGNDWIIGGLGDDFIDGGTGSDIAYYTGKKSSYTIYKSQGIRTINGPDGNDTLENVDMFAFYDGISTSFYFMGSSANDDVQGSLQADTFDGFDGNDTLRGAGGNDVLASYSHDGRDEYGQYASDSFGRPTPKSGWYQDKDFLYGEDGDDMLIGNKGDDSIEGGNGNDTLSGDYGNDFLSGGKGDDVIYSIDFSNDFYINGEKINFYINQGKIKIDGNTFPTTELYDNNDTLYGGEGNDVFYISSQESYAYGDEGDDTFYLGDINYSTIYGGDGNDTIKKNDGSSGSEIWLDGGEGNDSLILGWQAYFGSTLIGGNGNDTLQGGSYMLGGDGDDEFYVVDNGISPTAVIDGGTGKNTLFASVFNNERTLPDFELIEISKFAKSEYFLKYGVTIQIKLTEDTVNMNKIEGSTAINYLLQNGFTHFIKLWNSNNNEENFVFYAFLKNIQTIKFTNETLNLESMLGNRITISTSPSKNDDLLTGTNRSEKISALAGNDTIIGGFSADTLTGGAGADVFKLTNAKDSGIIATTRDTITDFKHSEDDKIDLSALDANEKLAGDQAFAFIGNAAFSKTNAAGQLHFDATNKILYGSTDADTAPEFSIQLNGITALVANDFVL
ncbi:MAG: calcium-binding protein [Methylococcaceae bacterium]